MLKGRICDFKPFIQIIKHNSYSISNREFLYPVQFATSMYTNDARIMWLTIVGSTQGNWRTSSMTWE